MQQITVFWNFFPLDIFRIHIVIPGILINPGLTNFRLIYFEGKFQSNAICPGPNFLYFYILFNFQFSGNFQWKGWKVVNVVAVPDLAHLQFGCRTTEKARKLWTIKAMQEPSNCSLCRSVLSLKKMAKVTGGIPISIHFYKIVSLPTQKPLNWNLIQMMTTKNPVTSKRRTRVTRTILLIPR